MADDFSIGTLAERTGVTPNVLRTWEHRFGFPTGRRTAAGHRRFTEADADLVREVLAARDRGVPLHLAVASVRQRTRQEGADSVHAALVREFPDLRPLRLGRSTLVAASHALEDECLARAERSVVLGTFQDDHQYARSRHRWEELARTALWSAVLADFDAGTGTDPDPGAGAGAGAGPVRCHLAEDSPLRREWTVVTLGATSAAVLAAWEVPTRPGEARAYEAVVTTRRAPAVAAARVLVATVRAAGTTPPSGVEELLAPPVPDTATTDADRLLLRVLERTDARRAGRPG